MIAMNQNFLYFFLKTDIYKHKHQAQMFIKSYTSKLNKSFIGDQEYFNTNLYTNLFSNEDDFFQAEIDDLTQLECQCNNWHIEDSIKKPISRKHYRYHLLECSNTWKVFG